ncbi:ABC transporter substrate-binding protein [Oceanimonas sp. MB9]|uniref:ABC transporter substrate-binding protein n=1 Tax=Oceanimonas sp. MB9 TaxID=2588453 RepID=UPI0013F5A901|nr:ABC transporter substrate-binding protein [Oceanimonas sp. MB9]NHI01079.1 putative ABC transporter solute-binding protein YclQ [Oceanimonas sp. MB9]
MKLATVLSAAGLVLASQLAMAAAPARIVSFDHGSLDTLDALGLGKQVVAVPKQAMPAYLSAYTGAAFNDAGSLKEPDIDALKAAEPSLILITGRQGGSREQLETVAPVRDVTLQGDDYWSAFSARVRSLAGELGAADGGERALGQLERRLAELRAGINGDPEVLVVTHNEGKFSLRHEAVVEQLLKLKAPELPDGVDSVTHGARSFTPLTPALMAQMQPAAVLVVDRSAAIGGEPLEQASLRQALDAAGGQDIRLGYLSPALWYLSGGGLQSVRLQAEEVAAVL